MYEAYAVIFTTFHVIGALLVIGLVCWQAGRIRARILWNLEDEVCDMEDECLYIARNANKAVLHPIRSIELEFDLSDVSGAQPYIDGIDFDPCSGTWFCSEVDL